MTRGTGVGPSMKAGCRRAEVVGVKEIMFSMKHWIVFLAVSMSVVSCVSSGDGESSTGKPASLIPRQVIFGNPEKAAARLSPDGRWLAYLAPVNGVLNVWVGSPDDPDAARPVTKDTKRGIRQYSWAYTSEHVLYRQDTGGDENWRVYSVELATDKTTDLTPFEKVAARIEKVSEKFPTEILVGLNDRDERFHDIYRLDIATGERTIVEKNEGFLGFVSDDDYRVRFAEKMTPGGGNEYFKKAEDGSWQSFMSIDSADMLTTNIIGFDKTGARMFMVDSRGRDTAALTRVDLESGESEVLAENPRADVSQVMVHPTEKTVQAVASNYERVEWEVLDDTIASDLEFLRSVSEGEVQVVSRTLDDMRWIVVYLRDDGPVRYYLYDRAAREAKFLFTNRRELEELSLAKMHPVVLDARDGFKLVSYLSLPVGSDPDGSARPEAPLPLVLNVHGGPWARDSWGYNSTHQWLANRGYAVLSVNFRGSTGFGKAFLNAGDREWAAKMHDDLLDAVDWAIAEKIADPDRIAIMGGSYGGYATLVGLTFTPEKFACGVDIVGPSNLITLLSTIPAYWAPMIEMMTTRVGDHRTDEGRAFLEERSPLTHVDKITRPLLIGQGANDPRVKQAEADQIVAAMQAKSIPVTYVLYPDEGHGFARPGNRLSFYAIVEGFLAEHLGGAAEPIGDDFEGSSVTVPTGAGDIAGLEEALLQARQAAAVR